MDCHSCLTCDCHANFCHDRNCLLPHAWIHKNTNSSKFVNTILKPGEILYLFLLGFFISIGALIDESQEHNHISNRACAKSRQFLLLLWVVVGCLLSMSYRSVLLASLVSNEFAGTIDTIEDILHSGLPYYVAGNSGGPVLLNGDPRPSVKELVKNQVRYYDLINVEMPEIVKYG